jgi:hypothetical protein
MAVTGPGANPTLVYPDRTDMIREPIRALPGCGNPTASAARRPVLTADTAALTSQVT